MSVLTTILVTPNNIRFFYCILTQNMFKVLILGQKCVFLTNFSPKKNHFASKISFFYVQFVQKSIIFDHQKKLKQPLSKIHVIIG